MTHDQWMQVFAPIVSAIVLGLAGLITLVLSGVAARLRAYLDARGAAAASSVVADASTRLQAAMTNGAGQLALQVQRGTLDITDENAIRAAAIEQASRIALKIPDAVATLKPLTDAIVEGIEGKLGNSSPVSRLVPALLLVITISLSACTRTELVTNGQLVCAVGPSFVAVTDLSGVPVLAREASSIFVHAVCAALDGVPVASPVASLPAAAVQVGP